MREQLEQHRKNAICASCHVRMDPLGFGLENFDAIGAWRTKDGQFPINASGTLPDGRSFDGPQGLESILKAQPDAFAECLTRKLLIYALGRGLEPADDAAVKKIVKKRGRGQLSLLQFDSGDRKERTVSEAQTRDQTCDDHYRKTIAETNLSAGTGDHCGPADAGRNGAGLCPRGRFGFEGSGANGFCLRA